MDPKVTTVRMDDRMLENVMVIKADAQKRDGLDLSTAAVIKKSLELTRRRVEADGNGKFCSCEK